MALALTQPLANEYQEYSWVVMGSQYVRMTTSLELNEIGLIFHGFLRQMMDPAIVTSLVQQISDTKPKLDLVII
jgi:hypothetical protein